jgi:hypothetical protein
MWKRELNKFLRGRERETGIEKNRSGRYVAHTYIHSIFQSYSSPVRSRYAHSSHLAILVHLENHQYHPSRRHSESLLDCIITCRDSNNMP